ncbi:hypothetical protein FLX08_10120 [Microbispora hainanensis]|uniref:Uncharacterized protein n=1 Tax=Microbispora hainanensis TaxID=568844 RepID=A0A544YYT3_9ACTN|nr:hypothetical protein FLX08_10120 [Microbispora hainanensis]
MRGLGAAETAAGAAAGVASAGTASAGVANAGVASAAVSVAQTAAAGSRRVFIMVQFVGSAMFDASRPGRVRRRSIPLHLPPGPMHRAHGSAPGTAQSGAHSPARGGRGKGCGGRPDPPRPGVRRPRCRRRELRAG